MKAAVICTLLAMAMANTEFLPKAGNNGSPCANSSDSGFDVSVFQVTPWPVTRGQASMTMTGTSSVNATVKGLSIEVIFKGQPFYHETVAENGSLSAGAPYTVNFSTDIPGIAPPGDYEIQASLETTEGTLLNCWQLDFSLN